MPRIKIELPKSFIFSTDVTIRISDVNYGGHLGNDRVLALIQEARTRFLRKYQFTELDVCGVGTIQVDAALIYKAEAFHGDIINIALNVDDFHRYGCHFYYRLTNKKTDKEIARAKTGLAFFDYEKRKLARTPEEFLKLCEEEQKNANN